MKSYLQALHIDWQHSKQWFNLVIKDLARILKQLGENQFDRIWREVTCGDCAGEVREVIWGARDKLDTED